MSAILETGGDRDELAPAVKKGVRQMVPAAGLEEGVLRQYLKGRVHPPSSFVATLYSHQEY